MPRNQSSQGTVTNTYKGSENARGEFIHDTDDAGKWIKSNNLRVTGPEGYTMKNSLTAKQVSGFGESYSDLQFIADTDYILISTNKLDGNKDKNLEPATVGFYRPKRAQVSLP
jgi:hypothetical protein